MLEKTRKKHVSEFAAINIVCCHYWFLNALQSGRDSASSIILRWHLLGLICRMHICFICDNRPEKSPSRHATGCEKMKNGFLLGGNFVVCCWFYQYSLLWSLVSADVNAVHCTPSCVCVRAYACMWKHFITQSFLKLASFHKSRWLRSPEMCSKCSDKRRKMMVMMPKKKKKKGRNRWQSDEMETEKNNQERKKDVVFIKIRTHE